MPIPYYHLSTIEKGLESGVCCRPTWQSEKNCTFDSTTENTRMESVRAKKHLGQHFLTNHTVAQRIAESISDYLGTPILEIGPGMGVLTKPLLETGHDLQVIDIDHESIEYLQHRFTELSHMGRIIEGDFLKIPAEGLIPGRPDTPLAIIGNYPYNISSQIFFRILELRERVPAVAGMLQHEVAQRLCAPPGGRDYGILSVLLQCWYDCTYLFRVSKQDFNPPPKVDGGVMIARRNNRISLPCEEKTFKLVVKTAFSQRRKMLRNAMMTLFGKEYPYDLYPVFTLRAERLSVEDFISLTLMYEELLGNDI